MPENVLTVQLIGKEDQVNDDTITMEDKWSLYVDHFVQLSTTEGIKLKRRDPFLKRNLPDSVVEERSSDIQSQSGLELKICVNTYRIFFVNDTEDYFRRKHTLSADDLDSFKAKRHAKFRSWLDSDQGWKRELASEPAHEIENSVHEWLISDMNIDQIEGKGSNYRRFHASQMQIDN